MNKEIPYLKVVRMAIITAPLFGLFGAAPILGFNNIALNTVIIRFLVITSVTLVTWAVNMGLLLLSNRLDFIGKDWVRYITSAVVCVLIFILASQLVPNKPPAPPVELAKIFPKGYPMKGPEPLRILMPLIQAMSINLVIIVLLEMMLLQDKKRKIEETNKESE